MRAGSLHTAPCLGLLAACVPAASRLAGYPAFDMSNTSPPRRLCEHDGKFNMLHPLLHHMQANQKGLGVVAVSPRYALRQV